MGVLLLVIKRGKYSIELNRDVQNFMITVSGLGL